MRDLLTEWYTKALLFSSRFHIVPLIERQKIDFIRDTLLLSFPAKYFHLQTGREISSNKVNWIKSLLLASDRLSCVKALYEIAVIIKYSQTLGEEIQEEFKDLQKSPFNLRSFLFELSVFRTLDYGGIRNTKKPMINGQTLEGLCTLNGQEYLFECKQLYMPNLDELFVIQRLIKDLRLKCNNKSPLNGYIVTIKLNKPVTEKHRIEFGKKITSFYEGLPHAVNAKIDYKVTDELGELRASSFEKEKLMEMEKEKSYDLIFYVEPTGEIRADGAVMFAGKVVGNFNIERDKIYKKLKSVLKDEKKQHKESIHPRKIVFLGSESYPEFQFGLFHQESICDQERIIAICERLNLKSIVCIIRKYYQSEQPSILIDVISPNELLPEANILKYIFSSAGV